MFRNFNLSEAVKLKAGGGRGEEDQEACTFHLNFFCTAL